MHGSLNFAIEVLDTFKVKNQSISVTPAVEMPVGNVAGVAKTKVPKYRSIFSLQPANESIEITHNWPTSLTWPGYSIKTWKLTCETPKKSNIKVWIRYHFRGTREFRVAPNFPPKNGSILEKSCVLNQIVRTAANFHGNPLSTIAVLKSFRACEWLKIRIKMSTKCMPCENNTVTDNLLVYASI